MSHSLDRTSRDLPGPTHTNSSVYTLESIDERSPLLLPVPHPEFTLAPGVAPAQATAPSKRFSLWNAILKLAIALVVGTGIVVLTLWLLLPTLAEEDRGKLHFPSGFPELQALNILLKKYKGIYPFRIIVSYVVLYVYLQSFCIPGSTSLSILAGAIWGVPVGTALVCLCVATGASVCYYLSDAFGPAVLAYPKWRARLDSWSLKVNSQRENLFAFMIVLRLSPFPPHWFVNLAAPHLGIPLAHFWASTFLGMIGMTIIQTTIGSGLEQMTSADDFHLFSLRNVLGLSAIAVGVLLPVAIRRYYAPQVAAIGHDDEPVLSDAIPPLILVEEGGVPKTTFDNGSDVNQERN